MELLIGAIVSVVVSGLRKAGLSSRVATLATAAVLALAAALVFNFFPSVWESAGLVLASAIGFYEVITRSIGSVLTKK